MAGVETCAMNADSMARPRTGHGASKERNRSELAV